MTRWTSLGALLVLSLACGDPDPPTQGSSSTTNDPMTTEAASSTAITPPGSSTGVADGTGSTSTTGDSGPVADSSSGGVVVPCPDRVLGEPSAEPLGAFEVIAGELYVVRSGLGMPPMTLVNTVHMVLLRGQGAEVWMMGAGYGDPEGDVAFYRPGLDAIRDAAADALDVDQVIQGCFGLSPDNAELRLLAPHMHLDHYNADIIVALQALGYPAEQTRIQVHAADLMGASCEAPCCGQRPCMEGGGGPFFGTPFDPPLPAGYSLESIGAMGDACDDEVMTLMAPTGQWTVRAATGHTNGSLNVDNADLELRIRGSADECMMPGGWTVITPHSPP